MLQNKQGRIDAKSVPQEGKLLAYQCDDVLIGNIRPYLRKIWFSNMVGGTNGDVLVIRSINKDILDPKYMYHILSDESFFVYDNNNAKGAKMPRGDKKAIMKYIVYVPLLKEQKHIVSILDRFDALYNDISQGIPAEIEARQKQYEYYREKLLTFKELV